LEAAKQSGRARLPEVPAPVAFASLLANEANACGGQTQCLLFTERDGRGLAETLRAWETRPVKLTALVGPEGGWETEEIAQARAAGWHLVTFGGRILRAETAAIVVTGLLQHLYGDLV
jgi:16S rRNA (uracil1498-N3)-methyltransferase